MSELILRRPPVHSSCDDLLTPHFSCYLPSRLTSHRYRLPNFLQTFFNFGAVYLRIRRAVSIFLHIWLITARHEHQLLVSDNIITAKDEQNICQTVCSFCFKTQDSHSDKTVPRSVNWLLVGWDKNRQMSKIFDLIGCVLNRYIS